MTGPSTDATDEVPTGGDCGGPRIIVDIPGLSIVDHPQHGIIAEMQTQYTDAAELMALTENLLGRLFVQTATMECNDGVYVLTTKPTFTPLAWTPGGDLAESN